jgi:bacteriocin biosynthesis cyclodehydratase domain-containing protein
MTSLITLPERPLLKPWYRLVHDEERLVLEYGGSVLAFEGRAVARLVPALLPLLDGERTVAELTTQLGLPAEPAIENALELLARHDALTEGPAVSAELPRPVRETAELLAANHRGSSPLGVLRTLASARVDIAGEGPRAAEIARLLRRSGVGGVEPLTAAETVAAGTSLVVAAPTPAEEPGLRELNALAIASEVPWLQVLAFDGVFAAVGPLFVPGESCCHVCYLTRRAANVPYRDDYNLLSSTAAPFPSSPALDAVVTGLAATLALRWLSHREGSLPGILHALEYHPTPRLTRHVVHRVPRCEVCSGMAGVAAPFPWSEDAAG